MLAIRPSFRNGFFSQRIFNQAQLTLPETRAFYRQSSVHGIDYGQLQSMLQERFLFSEKRLGQVITLLKAHAPISDDFPFDIADAIERYVHKKPPRVDRNADVILRYDELMNQGATKETWNSFYQHAAKEKGIERNRAYAVEGRFSVKKASYRKLSEENTRRLVRSKSFSYVAGIIGALDVSPNALFLDFLEEERIPKKIKADLLLRMNFEFDPRTSTLSQHGSPYEIGAPQREELGRMLLEMMELIPTRELQGRSAQDAYFEAMLSLGIHYLYATFPHFREHVTEARIAFEELQEVKASDHEVIQAKARSWHEHLKDIATHGLPDYNIHHLLSRFNEVTAQNDHTRRFYTIALTALEQFQQRVAQVGKYFEETSDASAAHIDLLAVPVKGLAAAVAIDSGSDCGKGHATERASMAAYSTALLTDPSRTKLWGYAGSYEVESDGGLLIQIDALNPSTQLELSGHSFLRGIFQWNTETLLASHAAGEEPIHAFLMSRESTTISNRDSVASAATSLFKNAPEHSFTGIVNRLQKQEEGLFSAQEARKEAEELHRLFQMIIQKVCAEFEKLKSAYADALKNSFVGEVKKLEGKIDGSDDSEVIDVPNLYERFRTMEVPRESHFSQKEKDPALLVLGRVTDWLGGEINQAQLLLKRYQEAQIKRVNRNRLHQADPNDSFTLLGKGVKS